MTSFIRSIFTLSSGTVLAQLIPVLATPILTRYVSVDSFAALATFVAIIAILVTFSTGKYELAIMEEQQQEVWPQIFYLSLACVAATCAVLIPALLLANALISINLSTASVFIAIPIGLFLQSFSQSAIVLANRRGDFFAIAASKVVRAIVMVSVQIATAVWSTNLFDVAEGLIIGYVSGQLAGSLFLFLRMNVSCFPKWDRQEIIRVFKTYRDYPLKNSPSSLLNSFSTYSPIFLLPIYFAESAVGLFALSQRVLQTPMTFIGSSLSQVYYHRAANLIDQKEKLSRETSRMMMVFAYAGFLPALAMISYGEAIFALVFGSSWAGAGKIAESLTPWLYTVFVVTAFTPLFNLYKRQHILLLFNILMLAMRVFVLFVIPIFFNDITNVVIAYSYASTAAWLFLAYCLSSILGWKDFTRILLLVPLVTVIAYQIIKIL